MTVLWSSDAEAGTVGQAVSSSDWDATASGDYPDSLMYYRNDTPVSNAGLTKYFRVDTTTGQHDSWNIKSISQINLSTSTTYYIGAFLRFDRINGNDIWHDTNDPDSYDKLLEFRGNIRWIILAGWPNSGYNGSYNGKYTYDLYSSPTYCTNCGSNEKKANVAPYDADNPYQCDYGRWYAVVMSYKPSSGGSATDGLVELFINGTKTTSLAQKTQDSSSPYVDIIEHSGTTAQPAYDAPPHYRKFGRFVIANTLTDMQNAGLMEDPEEGGALLPGPANLRWGPA